MRVGVCIFPAAAGVPKKIAIFFAARQELRFFCRIYYIEHMWVGEKCDANKLRVHGQGKEEG